MSSRVDEAKQRLERAREEAAKAERELDLARREAEARRPKLSAADEAASNFAAEFLESPGVIAARLTRPAREKLDQAANNLREVENDPKATPKAIEAAKKRFTTANEAYDRALARAQHYITEQDLDRAAARHAQAAAERQENARHAEEAARRAEEEARRTQAQTPTELGESIAAVTWAPEPGKRMPRTITDAEFEAPTKAGRRLRLVRLLAVLLFVLGSVLFAIFGPGLWGSRGDTAQPSPEFQAGQPAQSSSPTDSREAASAAPAAIPPAAAKPAPAAQPPAAEAVNSWFITKAMPTVHGLKEGAAYDDASVTVRDFNPAAYRFIAISDSEKLNDVATGANASTPPDGIMELTPSMTDDYIVVTVDGPSGDSRSVTLEKNTNMGAALGNQAVISGTYPSVRVITDIKWSPPAVTNSAARSETGELTDWFAQQGRGTYTFHVTFFNEFTDAAAHNPTWLLAGN